ASDSPPNQSSGDWYSITSAASALSCSAARLRRSRSRACACARACSRRKRRSTRSITAERECFDPANLSMDTNTSLESVTEVFSFILLLYYRRRRSGSPNHNPPKKIRQTHHDQAERVNHLQAVGQLVEVRKHKRDQLKTE